MVSCDTLLEEPIYDFRTEETAFDNEESTIGVLNGFYTAWKTEDCMASRYPQMVCLSSVVQAREVGGQDNAVRLEWAPSNDWLAGIYNSFFNTVARSNFILTTTEGREEDYITNARGYAHFIRAFSYFTLVRLFGPVPIASKPVRTLADSYVGRPKSIDANYNLIIDDLKKAYQLLPLEQDVVYWPKSLAAYAVLSKVYAQMASNTDNIAYWQLAKAYADTVIQFEGDDEGYELVEDYKDVISIDNEFNEESIFELPFSNKAPRIEGVGSVIAHIFAPKKSGWTDQGKGGWGRIGMMREIYDTIVATHGGEDNRFRNNCATQLREWQGTGALAHTYPYPSDIGGRYWHYPATAKYRDPVGQKKAGEVNWVFLRYADILLTYAEADNEINGPTTDAIAVLNQLFDRARSSTIWSSDTGIVDSLPKDIEVGEYTTKEEFRKRIMVERYAELWAEGHAFYDVRRRGIDYFRDILEYHNQRVDSLVQQGTSSPDYDIDGDFVFPTTDEFIKKNLLLPIPLEEINSNDSISLADQNFGY